VIRYSCHAHTHTADRAAVLVGCGPCRGHALDHLRDQAARKRKLWALQALISRIWPSFFLCCWLSAHKQHVRRVFFVTTSGVAGLRWQQAPPDGLEVGRGTTSSSHTLLQGLLLGIISGNTCVHSMRWPKPRAELWLKRCYTQYLRAVVLK
jgi:hypothetical protein